MCVCVFVTLCFLLHSFILSPCCCRCCLAMFVLFLVLYSNLCAATATQRRSVSCRTSRTGTRAGAGPRSGSCCGWLYGNEAALMPGHNCEWTVDCTQSMQLPVLPVAQANNNLIFNRIMQALINTPTQAVYTHNTHTQTHTCSHILGPLN